MGPVVNSTLLCFDEGPGAGLGHRRRMEVLALALHDRGHQCRLAPIDHMKVTSEAMVVVDSYRVRADELSVNGATVVAVDDLARDLAVDVVVDPSPGADAARHQHAHKVFAGAPYALVHVPEPKRAVVSVTDRVERVLVTTGAADATGHGANIAGAVRAALPDAAVRLVVGPWGATTVPDGVIGVNAPPSLAEELAAAPIVVTAGGVSMLEACLLGRAVVAVVTADNQRVAVDALADAGAVVATSVDNAAAAVAALAADRTRRSELASAARAVIDGQGAARIAAELTN